jgi:hypothetical protein
MAKFEFRLPTIDDIRNSTNGQIMPTVISNDYDEPYMLVTGVAGERLDVIAFYRVIVLLNKDKKVLFLSHSKMLNIALCNLLQKQGISDNCIDLIQHWQGVANSAILPSVLCNHFKDYELILFEPNLKENEFQFFVNTFGRIYIFVSPDILPVNNDLNEKIIKKYIEQSYNEFTLQFDYRNTYQVYNFARHFVPDSVIANDKQQLAALKRYKNNGDLPDVLGFKSILDLLKRICLIISNYNGFNRLIILPEYTNSGLVKNILHGYGYEATILDDDTDLSDLKSIMITSLEHKDWLPDFDIVIFVDFQVIDDTEITRKLLYHKLILARDRIVITYVGDFPPLLNSFPVDTYQTGDLLSNFVNT